MSLALQPITYKEACTFITYTLLEEPGTSLRAAGWRTLYETRGDSWSRPSRPRVDAAPTGPKRLWEAV